MATEFVDYYYVQVRARAVIGSDTVSITSLDLTYELDRMPHATLTIPLGRQVNPEALGGVAASEGVITNLLPFEPVKVYLTLVAKDGRDAPASAGHSGFPDGEFLAFTGYVSGIGESKESMGRAASLVVAAYGQPVTLSGSSQLITGMVEPATSQTGAMPIVCKMGNEGAARIAINEALLKEAPAPMNDLWALGMKQLMKIMVKASDAWAKEANEVVDNSFAAIGLNRINLNKALPAAPLSLLRYAVDPLGLASALHRTMTNVLYMNWAAYESQTNLWTALQGFREHFFFHFVPAVEEDAVAPITFALSGEPFVTLNPSEYYLLKTEIAMGEGPESARYYSYMGSVALTLEGGGWQPSPWQKEDMVSKPLGFAYVRNMPKGTKGRFHMHPAPAWLLPPGAPGSSSLNTGDGGCPDASNPEASGGGGETASGGSQAALENQFIESGLGDAVAGSVLYDNLFDHRSMTVAGRLRFDVAPGSLMRVNTVGEKFTGRKDTLFGHVRSVRIEVGEVAGGGSYARTTFDVGHVRSDSEHKDLTVEAHPLYQVGWRGGKLVDY